MSRRPALLRRRGRAAGAVALAVGAGFASLVGCAADAAPTSPAVDVGTTAPEPIGAETSGMLIATTAGPGGVGAVMISESGGAWETVLETGPLHDIAAGPEGFLAAGSAGAIWASRDGRSWTEAGEVPDPLSGIAYGDGTWVAIGEEAETAGDASSGVIHRSTDGVSWTRATTTSPYDNAALEADGIRYQGLISVAYGAGMWVVTGQDCAESDAQRRAEGDYASTCVAVQFHSADGIGWTRRSLGAELLDTHVAHDGGAWGFVGSAAGAEDACGDDSAGDVHGVGGVSDDALTWRFGATGPGCLHLAALAHDASGWWALDQWSDAASSAIRIHRSDDLITWTPTGLAPPGATSIVRTDG